MNIVLVYFFLHNSKSYIVALFVECKRYNLKTKYILYKLHVKNFISPFGNQHVFNVDGNKFCTKEFCVWYLVIKRYVIVIVNGISYFLVEFLYILVCEIKFFLNLKSHI